MWEPPYKYFATVDRVVDGDTVDLAIDVGMSITFKTRCRLFGIDAWETRGPERSKGLLAKERLIEMIEDSESKNEGRIFVHTVKDKTGKYGRYLVTLWEPTNDLLSFNERLVIEGHAEEASY
jgi:micrococcal nuclease